MKKAATILVAIFICTQMLTACGGGGGHSAAPRDITSFTILGIPGTVGPNTVALTVPYGTVVTSLTPTIVITGASVSPASGVAKDFTNPVTYTVTAADGTTKDYTVTVTVAKNTAKDITSFSMLGIPGTVGANTAALTVPYGTNPSSLTPTIVITGASVSPASGAAKDFTNPVTYTVTAADGSTKAYTVTVTVAKNSAKDITAFTILGISGTVGTNTVTLTVPYGTNPSSLTPTIVHTGASVSPASGVAKDFTNPVTYTVTAADGSTKAYTVTVTVALNPAKDITSFSILGIPGTVGANTVTLTVPYGTDPSNLTPTITITGASVSPASGVPHNFSTPQTYTVTAANGTTKDYTVTVTVAPYPAKDITKFTMDGIDGTIGSNTIALTVPYGTDVTALAPTVITITGVSVSPGVGDTKDFTNPVTYTVKAYDNSTKDYTVTVTVAPYPAKDITKFTMDGIDGTIGSNTIALTVPYGTDVTTLAPTVITITGVSVSPGVGDTKDFTNPVTYTVKAYDNSTKDYTVTVTVAPYPAKDITKFTMDGIDGTIGSNTIALTVPYGTDVTALAPTVITITGVSVSPGVGDTKDFTNPVTYTVKAYDNSTKDYTVTVTVAPYPAKDITKFTMAGIDGTIGSNTIALTVPYGTDVTALAPTVITITGVSVSPGVGDTKDFTNPVTYTVKAYDNSTKDYTVTVTVAPYPAKNITKFTIYGIPGTITEGSPNTITITVPYDTDVTSLTPTITITGVSVSPASGVAQDFTNPVTYTVKAYDNSTKDYTVTVTVGSPSVTFTADGVSFNMIYVPGKGFPTGTADSGTATVTNAYWIGETQVTYELWDKVHTWAIANGYTFANPGHMGGGPGTTIQHPVTAINWRDAMVWANAATEWYNAKNVTSYTPVYTYVGNIIRDSTDATACDNAVAGSTNGFRLLTSNEWELAARWRNDATNTVAGYSNPWFTKGNSASGATADYNDLTATGLVAVYNTTSTAAVKSKTPNALSLYDMSGNVWEWCFDLSGSNRVCRGGAWRSATSDYMRVGYVNTLTPPNYDDSTSQKMGLRLAQSE